MNNTISKISKAQEEIWEAKDKLYMMVKDLPKDQRVAFLLHSSKSLVEEIKKRKEENSK